MKNEFTLENTKDATHVRWSDMNHQFVFLIGDKVLWQDGKFRVAIDSETLYDINLTDQTGRGYPTLEWFLKCGYLTERYDEIKGNGGAYPVLNADHSNKPSAVDSELYVISTHDNRHDLTAMARDEYYSKHEKQWPKNDRINAIGQNGNNGEHYLHESESPLSPNFDSKTVYTQEVMLNNRSGWVKAIVTHKGKRFTTFQVESGREYSRKNSKLKVRELDTRTDEEKLREALVEVLWVNVNYREETADLLMSKFTITLNEEG